MIHMRPHTLIAVAMACCFATGGALGELLTNGAFDDQPTPTDNIANEFNFDQNPLGRWQGPGTGWDAFDDGSGNHIARRTDGFSDMLAQVISGATVTSDLTLSFDLYSLDEDSVGTTNDDNSFAVKVFGVTGSSFDFDLGGGFDSDFTGDIAGEGFVELVTFAPNIGNQTIDQTYSVPVDIDAGGLGTPPYNFIVVVFAAGMGSTSTAPAVTVSTIEIDNVSLVPEPGAVALSTLGAGLILLRRRRSA